MKNISCVIFLQEMLSFNISLYGINSKIDESFVKPLAQAAFYNSLPI
jgi:hypothetical protein